MGHQVKYFQFNHVSLAPASQIKSKHQKSKQKMFYAQPQDYLNRFVY